MIGKLMGIDHGLARIGVAVSDPLGITARELAIVINTTDAAVFDELRQLAQANNVVGLVVGYPSNAGGSSEQADVVGVWAAALKAHVGLPLRLWDEQLSSADAREIARQQKRDSRAPVDDLAARVILQSYINALADGLAQPPQL